MYRHLKIVVRQFLVKSVSHQIDEALFVQFAIFCQPVPASPVASVYKSIININIEYCQKCTIWKIYVCVYVCVYMYIYTCIHTHVCFVKQYILYICTPMAKIIKYHLYALLYICIQVRTLKSLIIITIMWYIIMLFINWLTLQLSMEIIPPFFMFLLCSHLFPFFVVVFVWERGLGRC